MTTEFYLPSKLTFIDYFVIALMTIALGILFYNLLVWLDNWRRRRRQRRK